VICPHCSIGTSPAWQEASLGKDKGVALVGVRGNCTECDGLIVLGVFREPGGTRVVLYPSRLPARRTPTHTPEPYATDFREAALVLRDSPKASAAVSRRLVQHLIRDVLNVRGRDLNAEIDEVIKQRLLPEDLAHDLDVLRNVGNFAAHPQKSTNTGEVLDVEPGEAEWLLDLLDELLQQLFTRPAIRAEKRAAYNAKLQEAGKPPLRGSEDPE
jgi:hypothetical protein